MKRTDLTAAEQEVMKAIWELNSEGELATTSTIRKKVSAWRGEKVYGQVIYSYVTKLENAGFVRVERSENDRIIVIPLIQKEKYMFQQVKNWSKYWNVSERKYALMMLCADESSTENDKQELRRLLDELN